MGGGRPSPRMRVYRWLYLAIGIALLGLAFRNADVGALWAQVTRVGWAGMSVVLLVYFTSFVSDSVSWQLTLTSRPLTLRWLRRLFFVRMVGEAFNAVTPAAGMGGEPIKAMLLKRHYGFPYRESGPSLLLAKTANVLMLVPFLGGGFLLLLDDARIPELYKRVAGAGLLALALGIALFYLVQRLRVSSYAWSRLSGLPAGARIRRRLENALLLIRELEDCLVSFYTGHGRRFAAALGLALLNWLLGVAEIYFAMHFLGQPVSVAEAWIIESVAQLVRAGTFFIPASIGAQEGAFLIVCTALTGEPLLGLALALVRRFRELVWIVAGLCFGWLYSFRRRGTRRAASPTSGGPQPR